MSSESQASKQGDQASGSTDDNLESDSNNSSYISLSNLPVAIDAAGGDLSYGPQIEGVVDAYKKGICRGPSVVLVGNSEKIKSKLKSLKAENLPILIEHASQEISMKDSPIRSVRKKPNSSLCVAYELVKNGKASSVVSAGNSGAMMAAGKFIWGLMPGIERPAIAALLPKSGKEEVLPNLILDAGANVDCHAHHLVQFAIMGSIYYETLFENKLPDKFKPKIGLLSNGEEASKGNDITRSTALLLSEIESLNYIGYVEGRDIVTAAVDVIICDGFVGNVVLKTMEGIASVMGKQLKIEGNKGVVRKLGMLLAKGVFRDVFKNKFDYTTYGGCPLLGLNNLALVLHGSSDYRSFMNAIKVEQVFTNLSMMSKIAEAIGQFEEKEGEDIKKEKD